MMTSEDQEVFEITDFTTVTEWERFIARIEQVIHEWSLATISPIGFAPLQKGELAQGEWQQVSKEIVFSNFKFTMVRYCLKQACGIDEGLPTSPVEADDDVVPKALGDMMDSGSDFPPQVHCLAQWYGLRDFVTISPSTSDAITSESKAKLLLSAVAIALNNTNCSIPMFVQIHPKAQQYFIGLCIGGGFRTDFAMVHLRKTPQYANNLTGLLDVFKSKLNSAVALSPIMVSVRFTYMLDDWSGSGSAWHNLLSGQEPFSFDPLVEFEDITTFVRLRFGAQSDPVCALYLSATWPSLSEDVIVESDVACDLNPLEAPYWLLRALIDEFSQGFMGDCLDKFLELCESCETVAQLLKGRIPDDDIAYSSALDRIAKPRVLSSISRVVQPPPLMRKKSSFGLGEGPIKHSLLFMILRYLFPDADPQDNRPYPATWRNIVPVPEEWECVQQALQGCKSAPFDCLVWRLGTVLAHCMYSLGGLPAVAHLWHEFILELRYRWELAYPIPGLETGAPNLGCSLLYQKLQMLNCCINKKKARESADSTSESHTDEEDVNVDDEDEFFECSEEEPPPRQLPVTHSLWNQPEGRLRKYKNYTLLNSDESLYIPITQEPSPMTEDLLEEQTEVLVKLGTDAQGAELRARMQSACLLSDMESFKAANPGSVLEDFVRWYSPRDWIEDGGKGHLSARMQLSGNMWADVWESAKPVPARRQKRLFDDTREGEKVLHHLSGLSAGKVAGMLLPCLGQQAVIRLMEEGRPLTTPGLTPILQQSAEKLVKCSRDPKFKFNKYKEVVSLISSGEFVIVQGLSLMGKLTPEPAIGECVEGEELEQLVSHLIDKPEVPLKGASRGSAGKVIHHLFMEAQKKANLVIGAENIPSTVRDFPSPVIREYILRTPCHRPAPYSNPSPQRMYATLTKDSFRLAAGLTQHNTFT